jgi:hypothetical protein
MAGPSSPSPNDSTPPNHSSSWKGTDRSNRTTIFGRNRRMSRLRPARRPISRTVSEVITEMHASSKMPCFNCIICTGAPHRRSTSAAKSSPKTAISLPSGVRICVGRLPRAPSSQRSGANRTKSGSLPAVSHGKSLRSLIRRNARRLSPSRPCQPSSATSSRSPAMDFTGYRKMASTCPISMSMLDPSPPYVRVDRALRLRFTAFHFVQRRLQNNSCFAAGAGPTSRPALDFHLLGNQYR